MKPNELEKFQGLIAALATCFGREADEPLYAGFKLGLHDLSLAEISRAVSKAISTCKFMPTVAELRELAGVLSPEVRAVKAWDSFERASRNPYQSVDFDDPVINATVRNIGGWQFVCSIDDRKEFDVFLRKRFESVYVALYKSGVSSEQCEPLVGLFDSANALSGYEVRQPVRIETGMAPPSVRISQSPRREPLGIGSVKRIAEV